MPLPELHRRGMSPACTVDGSGIAAPQAYCMPQQGNLFPPSGATKTQAVEFQHASRIPAWLRLVELVLFVVLRVYVGIVVFLLPWTPLWKSNGLLNHWPALATFCSYGAVRGIISGLGLLNLWAAITETFRHRFTRS